MAFSYEETMNDDTTISTPVEENAENLNVADLEAYKNSSDESSETIHSDSNPPVKRQIDNGSAASSRAFFLMQESQLQTSQTIVPPSCSIQIPAPPSIIFSFERLSTVSRLLNSVEFVAELDIARLPIEIDFVIGEIKHSNRSIFSLLSSKLNECQKFLEIPSRADWKQNRRALSDIYPVVLLDRLLMIFGLAEATGNVWDFDQEDIDCLTRQTDNLSFHMTECQRRLTSQIKMRSKYNKHDSQNKSPTTQPTSSFDFKIDTITLDLVESIGRLTRCVSVVIHEYLGYLSNHLLRCHYNKRRDPIVAAINQLHYKHSDGLILPNTSCISHHGLTDVQKTCLNESSHTLLSYIQTVHSLESSTLCREVFQLPEITSAISSMHSIRSGLDELSEQRVFDWISVMNQTSLPRNNVEFPTHILLEGIHHPLSDHFKSIQTLHRSNAIEHLQMSIGNKLTALSRSMASLYRLMGTVLSGTYEDVIIQQELTTVSVLSTYVSMVGSLFYYDLLKLFQWLSPHLSQIRRRIQQYTISSGSSTSINDSSLLSKTVSIQNETVSNIMSNTTTKITSPNVEMLLQLLSHPDTISLSRQNEKDHIFYFFLPHLQRTGSTPVITGSPADRMNRLLVWLAWEGDLLSLYQRLLKHTTDCTDENKDHGLLINEYNKEVEDAIIETIINGCAIVKEKFFKSTNIFHPFSSNTSTSPSIQWIGKGDDILDLCKRVSEALTLRYLGEVDLKTTRDLFLASTTTVSSVSPLHIDLPRWKICIVSHLARTIFLQQPTYISSKMIEGLPKLIGEFCHQSLFYSCPLRRLGTRVFENLGLSRAVASSAASTARLSGLVTDVDTRVTAAQYLGEVSLLNTHSNCARLTQLETQLNNLTRQIHEGMCSPKQHVLLQHNTMDNLKENMKIHEQHKTTDAIQMSPRKKMDLCSIRQESPTSISCALQHNDEAMHHDLTQIYTQLQCDKTEIQQYITNKLNEFRQEIDLKSNTTDHTCVDTTLLITNNANQCDNETDHQQQLDQYDVKEHVELFQTTMYHRINDLQLQIGTLQDEVRRLSKDLVTSTINKSKTELSSYLTQHLSHCIHNHIMYHFDRQQQQHRRRKFLSWVSPMSKRQLYQRPVTEPTLSPRPITSCTTPHLYPTDCQASCLIQSTHRHSLPNHAIYYKQEDDQDFNGAADSISIMDETTSYPIDATSVHDDQWYPTTVSLLHIPNPTTPLDTL